MRLSLETAERRARQCVDRAKELVVRRAEETGDYEAAVSEAASALERAVAELAKGVAITPTELWLLCDLRVRVTA